MKLKAELIEQIKKQQVAAITIQDRYSREPSVSLLFLEHLDENHNLISLVNSSNVKNKLCEQYITPIYIVDKDFNIEFIMDNWRTKAIHEHTIDGTPIEISEFSKDCLNLNTVINAKIQEKILSELSTLDEKILKTVDLEKYKEGAMRLYFDKRKPEFNLGRTVQMDQNILIDFLDNKGELKRSVISALSDGHLAKYEEYVAQKEIIKQYEETLKTEPGLKNINAIINIVNNDKQSYSIKYHDMRGNAKKGQFKKNVTNLKMINNTIIKHNVLSTIPIELIDEISWRSTILYEKDKTCPFKYSDKDTAVRLALLEHVEDISPAMFHNPDFVIEAISQHARLLKVFPEESYNNKDIVLKIMKNIQQTSPDIMQQCLPNHNTWEHRNHQTIFYIFQNLPNSLKTDKEFLKEYLPLHNGQLIPMYTSYAATSTYLEDLLKSIAPYLSDVKFAKIALESTGFDKRIVEATPDYVINDPEILNSILENKKQGMNMAIFKKIQNIDDLEKIFEKNFIQSHICDLSPNILCNRKYIYNNITNSALMSDNIVSIYNEDTDMINKLFENAQYTDCCKTFLDVIYPGADNIKIFELCSKNIFFYQLLKDDDKKIFIDGEMSDIENIHVDLTNIQITTPNCKIEIDPYGTIHIENKERPGEKCVMKASRGYDEYLEEKVIEALKDKYRLRSKIFDSVIRETLENHVTSREEER